MAIRDPLMGDDSALFEKMEHEAQATFSLAAASEGIEIEPDSREDRLVKMALQAGVVGALSYLRRQGAPEG